MIRLILSTIFEGLGRKLENSGPTGKIILLVVGILAVLIYYKLAKQETNSVKKYLNFFVAILLAVALITVATHWLKNG